MLNGFIVQKSFMSGHYTDEGKRLPLTKLVAKPLIITQLKSAVTDGYQAVQVAYGSRKKLSQPIASKLKKLKISANPKGFAEFRQIDETVLATGQSLSIDQVFKVGDVIDATATSKGRGFQGVIKRHGFKRQGETGGASNKTRAPGAIGAQTPGKVLKGKRMPGHMGNKTVTIENLKVVKIEENTLYVKGSVPGHFNAWVLIKKV